MFGIGMKLGRVAAVIGGLVSTILDSYAVNGKTPGLVVDSNGSDNDSVEVYNAGGTKDTFAEVITHSRAGQATMTDSDGNLKWAPHNLVTYSEDFSTSWVTYNSTPTASQSDPFGGTRATKITADTIGSFVEVRNNITGYANTKTTVSAIFKAIGVSVLTLRLRDAVSGSNRMDYDLNISSGTGTASVYGTYSSASGEITDLGDGWYKANLTATTGSNTSQRFDIYISSASVVSTGDFFIADAHAFRSDLGGMVDNPDRSDSYVPTTSSAVYLPRRNHHVYNGDAWVNEGILHESEARTNLITYSEDISHATGQWNIGSGGATLTGDAATAPSGETQAVKLVETTTTAPFFVYTNPFSQASGDITVSCYVKAAERNYASVQCYVDSGTRHSILVDLANGAIVNANSSGAPTIVSTGVEDVGNGWFRAHVSLSHTAGAIAIVIAPSDTANPSYTASSPTYSGAAGNGIYIWGAQIEAAPTPSSYIPTSGATVTRAAESLIIPAANLPWPTPIDPQSVSLQMAGRMTYADDDAVNTVIMHRWLFTGNDQIQARLNTASTNTGTVELFSIAASVSDSVSSADVYAPGVFVPFNIASRHGSTFINGAVDGVALTANTTPTALPDLSATDLNLGYDYMGTISEFRIWAADIADTGLVDATSP